MARVYRCWDTKLSAWRAVKAMAPEYASKKSLRQRFRREAQAMAALDHPSIVRVYDVVDEGAVPFIVMELVEGGSLEDWVGRNGKMPIGMAIDAMLQVCGGVQVAHDNGVIHRDLKPANVLVGLDGRCRIADFGIAHIEDDGAKKTRTGMVMGTMGYMAPEQSTDAKRVDARADVYALGATLLHLVIGESPVHLFPVVTPDVFDGLPDGLAEVLKKATAVRVEERTASVRDLARALEGVRAEAPRVPVGTPPLMAPPRAAPPIPDAHVPASPVPVAAPAPFGPAPAERSASVPTSPPFAGGTAVPTEDEVPQDKMRRLAAIVGYGMVRPPGEGDPELPLQRAYLIDDDKGADMRPELIKLTDEEAQLVEEARLRALAKEEEDNAERSAVLNVAGRTFKDAFEAGVQLVLAGFEFFTGKGLIISIPLALCVVAMLWKGHDTDADMSELQVKVVDSRKVLLDSMETDPTLAQDLIAMGGSAAVLQRAQQRVTDARTDAERAAAASDLIRIEQLQFDKLAGRTGSLSDPGAALLQRRLEKLGKACDRYDADRLGLTDLCASATGQVLGWVGFGPCSEVAE